jgi:hypothetical protein
MKVALCLSGHFRSYERVYPILKQSIIDPYHSDVFIATWDSVGFDGVRGDHQFMNLKLNEESLRTLFSPKKMFIEPQKKWDTSKYQVIHNIGLRNPEIIFGMFYGIFAANKLKSEFEQENNFKYDVVIRSRADLFFESILPANELKEASENNHVYVPKFGNYNGLNDQFAFGCSDSMNLYCDTYPNLDKFYDEGCKWHSETMVKFTVNHFNIPISRTDIRYFIMRANGIAFRLERKSQYGDVE